MQVFLTRVENQPEGSVNNRHKKLGENIGYLLEKRLDVSLEGLRTYKTIEPKRQLRADITNWCACRPTYIDFSGQGNTRYQRKHSICQGRVRTRVQEQNTIEAVGRLTCIHSSPDKD